MRLPKRYGSYQVPKCPFCSRQAIAKNREGVPVCSPHRYQSLPDLKCSCGEYVDLKTGKWGPYFSCFKCGNVRFDRIMEVNDVTLAEEPESDSKPRQTTVRSDELDFL